MTYLIPIPQRHIRRGTTRTKYQTLHKATRPNVGSTPNIIRLSPHRGLILWEIVTGDFASLHPRL